MYCFVLLHVASLGNKICLNKEYITISDHVRIAFKVFCTVTLGDQKEDVYEIVI